VSPSRHSGFTLLELLVALAVFSLVSVMAYSGLRTVLQSKQQTDEHAGRIQQLQSAVLMLERDLSQFVPRPVRDEYGDESDAWHTSDYGAIRLAFTRGGRRNPTAIARSTLQRVAYGVEDEQLLRFSWPVLDRAQGTEPYRVALLDGVREFSLRYRGDGDEWLTQWPPVGLAPGDPVPLPNAVEVTLELADMGKIRRLFPLFAEAMPTVVNVSGNSGAQGAGEGNN
jgi:general secretion pathway protein J